MNTKKTKILSKNLNEILDEKIKLGLGDALAQLDLSSYEIAIISALQILKGGSASEITNLSGVPKARIYEVLDKLRDKGLIQKLDVKGKSAYYRAINSTLIIETLFKQKLTNIENAKNEIIQNFLDLNRYQIELTNDDDQPFNMVFGQRNIILSLRELIQNTNNELLLSLSSQFMMKVLKDLTLLTDKGVKLKAIVVHEKEEELMKSNGIPYKTINIDTSMPVLKPFFSNQLDRVGAIISDGQISCLILPQPQNEPYAIITSHPFIIITLEYLFNEIHQQIS